MGAAATGSDGGSDRQQWQQRGAVKAPATARAVGTVAGCTWRHLGSFLVLLGLTWCHSVARGVTRFHSDLVLRHLVSLGVTWCHTVRLNLTYLDNHYTVLISSLFTIIYIIIFLCTTVKYLLCVKTF